MVRCLPGNERTGRGCTTKVLDLNKHGITNFKDLKMVNALKKLFSRDDVQTMTLAITGLVTVCLLMGLVAIFLSWVAKSVGVA